MLIKRKTIQQKIPKAWRKKKHSNHVYKKKAHSLTTFNKKSPGPAKTPFGQRSSQWKRPFALFFFCMICMILIVPTLIVLPSKGQSQSPTNTAKEEASNHDKKAQNKDVATLAASDSPFSVEVKRVNADKVENVPLETYVSRVVASEMPVDFKPEALKAQSLAARTYIVEQLLHQNKSKKKDQPAITDTTDNQVYRDKQQLQKQWGKDYHHNIQKINKAVADTKGEILTYNDAPIFPAFFSTSNGYTENSEDYWQDKIPYLRSVKSPWDKKSPKFVDQKVVSNKKVEKKLDVSLSSDAKNQVSRTDGGRVKKLKIDGKTFTGKAVREAFDLRSSDFTMKQKQGHVIFKTKGFGHGIGMSQYGANGMAKAGKNYKDILKHYYKGVKISHVKETAPTLVSK